MTTYSRPLFDSKTLEAELDEESAALMAECFLNDTETVAERLDEGVQTQTLETVRKAAHQLTGCCRAIMCEHVAGESSSLERAARSGDWDAINAQVNLVKDLCLQLRAELQSYLQR